MEGKGHASPRGAREDLPCPICRGDGLERRWRYDERTGVREEITRTCSFCGGSGSSPPRVEIHPEVTSPGWAWDMGSLT